MPRIVRLTEALPHRREWYVTEGDAELGHVVARRGTKDGPWVYTAHPSGDYHRDGTEYPTRAAALDALARLTAGFVR